MRAKFLVLALVACAAVTALVLWDSHGEGVRGHSGAAREVGVTPAIPAPAAHDAAPAPPEDVPLAEAPPLIADADPPPAGGLVGVVRAADGTPVRDAEVTIAPVGGTGPATTVHVDAAGFVRVDGLAVGTYRLDARHPQFAPRSFRFEVVERWGAGPFDIVLVEGGALRVRVLGAFGDAVAGQPVRVSIRERGEVRGGVTDSAGDLLFQHLPLAEYWIVLPAAGGATEQTRTATVEPGKTVDVVFDRSCSLRGTILGPDGRPLADAIVRLYPAEFGPEGYRSVEARTDAQGRFEVGGFPPGAQRVGVQVLPRKGEEPGYVASLGVLEFRRGEARDEVLRVPGNTLGGRVTRADTGLALFGSGVQVQAFGVEVEEGKRPVRKGDHNMAFPDKTGRYRFVGLPPGHYEIWVFAPLDKDLSPLRRVVDFTRAGTLDDVDFALPVRQTGRVRIRVLEPDGTPATGITFGVGLPGGITLSLDPSQVGDGVYEMEVEAGPRRISIYRKGFRAEEASVDVSAEGVVEREVRLTAQE